MKRRFINTVLLLGAFLSPLSMAQLKYMEGQDFKVLPQTIDSGKSPKIIEFFWFGCGHCSHIYPEVEKWLGANKSKVDFEFIPAVASSSWEAGAHLFYTAKELGIDERTLLKKVFEAIHDKRQYDLLGKKDAITQFLVRQFKLKEEDVESTWSSFKVLNAVNRAKNLFDQARLDAVPAFVINGRYHVENSGNTRSLLDKCLVLSTM